MNSVALEQYLSRIMCFLSEEGVTEVMINQPDEVIVEGSKGKRVEAVDLAMTDLQHIATMVGNFNNQKISKETPLLSGTLPGGERIQIVIPPAVGRGQIGFAIRKPSTVRFSLDDYQAARAYQAVEIDQADQEVDERLQSLLDAKDIDCFMRLAVQSHKNIIIAGGTASGKTSYANALMEEIDPDERILTIEDTPELRVPNVDHLSLLASKGGQGVAKVDIQALLEASLRLNPDRILLGELRGTEAFSFLLAANTGHPGAISTVHADSASAAIDQLTLMVQRAGLNLSDENIRAFLHRVIDVVVHWKHDKKSGKRYMTSLVFNNRTT